MKIFKNIQVTSKMRAILMAAFLCVLSVVFVSAINYKNTLVTSGMKIEIIDFPEAKNLITDAEIHNWLIERFGSEMEYTELDNIDTRELESECARHTNVERADVYVDAKNVLRVKITQKKPIFRMMNNNGSYYLGSKASRIPTSVHYTVRVMIVSGYIPTYDEDLSENDKETLYNLVNLYKELDKNKFIYKLIDHIKVEKNGDFTLSPVLGNFKIILGDTENIENKLKRLEEFYRVVIPRETWDKYQHIDLRFKDQVIAKKKKI